MSVDGITAAERTVIVLPEVRVARVEVKSKDRTVVVSREIRVVRLEPTTTSNQRTVVIGEI